LESARALASALERLELSTVGADYIGFAEVRDWGSTAFNTLLRVGVLVEAPPARSAVCSACYDGHFQEVVTVDELGGYINCPEHGSVPIPSERLEQWRFQLEGLAPPIRKALRISTTPRCLVDGRLLHLGTAALEGTRVQVFLARGVHWRDGQHLLDAIGASSGSQHGLVALPSVCPSSALAFTSVPLMGNLVLDKGRMIFKPPAGLLAPASDTLLKSTIKHSRQGRRRLEDDDAARSLFEEGESLRVKHPGITRAQVASHLSLPLSTYKRYVQRFLPKPGNQRPEGP
jgi:hypothetical protein